jgi:hypothetical protein
MKKQFVAISLLSLFAFCVSAEEALAQSCEQIRGQINRQTGMLPAVNTRLLQNLSLRQDCRFSAAEVYRAAFGDRPLPKQSAFAAQTRIQDDD